MPTPCARTKGTLKNFDARVTVLQIQMQIPMN